MQRIEGETVRVNLPPEKCESGLGKENKSPNPSQIRYVQTVQMKCKCRKSGHGQYHGINPEG